MNVGDMVTLSAAALNRDPLILWTEQCRNHGYGKPKPIGFVTEVQQMAKIGYVSFFGWTSSSLANASEARSNL